MTTGLVLVGGVEWSKIRTAKRPRGPLPESQTGMVVHQGI